MYRHLAPGSIFVLTSDNNRLQRLAEAFTGVPIVTTTSALRFWIIIRDQSDNRSLIFIDKDLGAGLMSGVYVTNRMREHIIPVNKVLVADSRIAEELLDVGYDAEVEKG